MGAGWSAGERSEPERNPAPTAAAEGGEGLGRGELGRGGGGRLVAAEGGALVRRHFPFRQGWSAAGVDGFCVGFNFGLLAGGRTIRGGRGGSSCHDNSCPR